MADKYLKESGTQLLVSLVKNSVNNALSKLNYYSEGSNTATLSTEHIYVTSASSIEMLSTNGGSYIDLDNSYISINAPSSLMLTSGNWSAANTGMININASIVNVHTLNMYVNANMSSIHGDSCSITTNRYFEVNTDTAIIESKAYTHIQSDEELRLIGNEDVNIRSNEGSINATASNYVRLTAVNRNIHINTSNGYAFYNGNEIATVNLIEKLQEEMDNYVFEASFNGTATSSILLQSSGQNDAHKYTITVGDNVLVNNQVANNAITVNTSNATMRSLSPRGPRNTTYILNITSGTPSTVNITKCSSDYFKISELISYSHTTNIATFNICPVTLAPNVSYMFNSFSFGTVDDLLLCSFAEVTNTAMMFNNCTKLNAITEWFTTHSYNTVEYANGMFLECHNMTYITYYSTMANTGRNEYLYFTNTVNASRMFYNCSNLTFAPDNGYSGESMNTAYIPNIHLYFNSCTNLSNMFKDCSNMRGKFILYAASNANVTNMFYNAGYEVNAAGGSHSRSIQVTVENADLFDNIWRALGNPSVSYANSNRVPYWTDSNNSSKWNIRLYNNVASMMNDNNARYTT